MYRMLVNHLSWMIAGLYIESQIDKGCNILSSKTNPISHSSNKSSLGVKLDRVHVENACGTGVQQSRKVCITVQPARVDA